MNCPICKKGKVNVTYVAGYMSYHVTRMSAGSKRVKFFHDPKVIVNSKCSNCKASKSEIKEAIERGHVKKMTHEERLKRIKESGLPTVIES